MSNTLLGGAIGDALGKFAESKPANYPPLLSWDGKTFLPSEHHGLAANAYTDDTQMSIMVAESLINKGFDPDDLSIRYVEWITSGRARGYGRTTLAAIQNLIAGKKYYESGIVDSYGNGTSMRAAPFGIYFRDDHNSLIEAATIDAKITHASNEAIAGSIAIALSVAYAVNQDTEHLLDRICHHLPDSKVKTTLFSLNALIEATTILPSAALAFLGTRADVRQTVPAVIYLFLKFNNYKEAVVTAIRSGMDADTTGAITGALFGAKGGNNIPQDWIDNVEDKDKLIALDSQLYNRSNENFFPRRSNA